MTAGRTIAFNLNGAHDTAVVQPHHTSWQRRNAWP